MGAKAKKSLKKKLAKASQLSVTRRAKEQSSNFLSLDGKSDAKVNEEVVENVGTVIYVGHIPHGFYEDEMEGFFKQFGKVKRLRLARSRRTGRSKHFGYIEFENPQVAKVVADEINNYLLFEHNLQVHLVPPERVHPKLWSGVRRSYNPQIWKAIERKRHNKVRTVEEHARLVKGILKRDEKRRQRIKDAGIDYNCPDFVGNVHPLNKKIKFADEEE
ncbi:hypothetical protein HPP92_008213 [Vanilla planifolia]|uniref:RRM domain-containing protein n=1 Tax=Vanilla planifolia TaxID=51239 RepID=A0A835RNW4_VANPL|nr:hypothetical protein HPP92_008213 [Vanilla planifolia]